MDNNGEYHWGIETHHGFFLLHHFHTDVCSKIMPISSLFFRMMEPSHLRRVGAVLDFRHQQQVRAGLKSLVAQSIDGVALFTQMGVSTNGDTPKWRVYNGKSFEKMDDDWG